MQNELQKYNKSWVNILLALSNVVVIYPIIVVCCNTKLSLLHRFELTLLFFAQGIASFFQHITETRVWGLKLRGIKLTSNPGIFERYTLQMDRALAYTCTAVSCVYFTRYYDSSFFLSGLFHHLLIAMFLLLVSDFYPWKNSHAHAQMYASVHLMWHVSIYVFLGRFFAR